MTIEDYFELLALTKQCEKELENYVIEYESNKITDYTNNILNVLHRIDDLVSKNNKLEIYIFRAVHDISTAAVRSYEGTELKNSIVSLRQFFMEKIPSFENYPPLGLEFKKYFP